jgi:hypothetical protein
MHLLPNSSMDAAPVPEPIIVDKSLPLNNRFLEPPTGDGSTPAFSYCISLAALILFYYRTATYKKIRTFHAAVSPY